MFRNFVLFYLVSSFGKSSQIITENNVDLEILNRNLLDSLKLHPRLNGIELTEEGKNLIDKYVDDFFDLTVKIVEDQGDQKTKRSLNIPETLLKDENGTSIFSGLQLLFSIPAHETKKIEIFQHGSKSYIAALEKDIEKDYMNFLVFNFENNKIKRKSEWIVPTAVDFSLYSKNALTFVVLKALDGYHSGIYTFNGKSLKSIQNLDFSYATDMKIWSTVFEEHMAVSSISNENGKVVIYKWLESYFDPIQTINEKITKLQVFSTENEQFLMLIINNIKNAEYSEIYKYNIQSGQYEIQQRIPTYNCRDVKFFTIPKNRGYDFYLALANYITGENNDEIPPIIYKYVDGYFLPFQNLKIDNLQQLEMIQTTGMFLMIARSDFSPLKTFQYDGWIFQESTNDINEYLPKISPSSIRTFTLEDKPILVTGFPNVDETLEIYQINFTRKNDLKQFHNEILSWCRNSLKQLESKTTGKNLTKRETSNIDINETEVMEKISRSNLILEQLENQLQNSLQMEGTHILQDIEVGNVVLNNSNIGSLKTETINNVQIPEILQNLIEINKDGEWTDTMMEHVQIDSSINPKSINGRDSNKMINLNDNLEFNQLNIKGTTIFSEPIITQTLNNIPFDQNNILMNNFEQKFESLNLENLQLENLTLQTINGQQITDFGRSEIDVEINQIPNLQTKKIVIGGFLNDIDMRTLNKYALRKSGDQVITAKYFFEELEAKNMEIENLSEKTISQNVVLTDNGRYEINQDVQFSKNLIVDKLIAENVVDTIPVVDGKLQVLLENRENAQRINAKKIFEEIELLSPINLQGNIQSEELDKINPTVSIDGPFILTGNFEIIGNTTVEKSVKTSDFTTSDGGHSVQKVLSDGLQLRENEIPIHLNFEQQLNVEEIFIDKVNGLNPQNWVVTGTNQQQNIHGSKIFLNDVAITGNTNFFKINNIEIPEFENSILRNKGEQIITGKHTIVNVVGQKVTGNHTTLGQQILDDILTKNSNQTISGTTVINAAVEIKISESQNMEIEGTINNLDFTEMAEDTVMKSAEKPIGGHKIFQDFAVKNMKISNIEKLDKSKIIYENAVALKIGAIENIRFLKSCNGENSETFGENTSIERKEQIVSDLRDFENFVIHGNVYIDSGFLNDVYLQDFEKNTVKIDEENSFEDVTFGGTIISEYPTILGGHIENVDLENLLLSHSEATQKILDKKVFKNHVSVFGNLILNEKINDFNLSNVCRFANSNEIEKQIEIHGNVIFTKGPDVYKIFNITIEDIMENTWFNNKEKVFENSIYFNNVTFHDDVTVGGFVDGVHINSLKDQYFSKSKDQNTNGGMFFANQVDFTGNLVSPRLQLNGAINGIKISDLPRTVLLQDEDQVFEESVYLEDLFVEDLQGKFTINNFNPDTDLLRHDKENIVTGIKKLDFMIAENVELQNGKTIQNVDILNWMQGAVLKKGHFNIEKRKIFRQNAHFNEGIQLQGPMNGEMFTNETIMLKSVPQNITGTKKFHLDRMDLMKFKYMKLKGLLNDMRMSELIDDQMGQSELILKSPIQFNNDVFTKNLNLESYKDVNISEFVSNVLDLRKMENLVEKYGKMLNISQRVHQKLQDHAFYLKYYKEVKQMKKPEFIVNSCCGNSYLIYLESVNETYFMNFVRWDENSGEFSDNVQRIELDYQPLSVRSFTLGRQQFLYMEYQNYGTGSETVSEYSIDGQFLRLDNVNQPRNCVSLKSSGVRQITPVKIDESECLLLLYQKDKPPQIFCDLNLDCILRYNQCLKTSGNYIHAAATRVRDVEFLILVKTIEDDRANLQGNVEIWCLHESQFGIRQILYLSDPPPKSVSTITYKGMYFLSVLYRSQKQGHVDILRYSVATGKYEQWQKITLDEPIKADFAILPSGELLLMILGTPSGTLTMYKYEGIARFKKFTSTTTISHIQQFKQFSMENKHFVTVENGDILRILKAQFKGILEES